MNVLLISTYELGRQPFGLASPAAWLRAAGMRVSCADVSRASWDEESVREADFIAFYVPMHTATRLALEALAAVRKLNPRAHICFYGLYAPVNEAYLRRLGAQTILGGEFEGGLLSAVERVRSASPALLRRVPSPQGRKPESKNVCPLPDAEGGERSEPGEGCGGQPEPVISLSRLKFLIPDRLSLPPLARYARLEHPDGRPRVTGYTEASRGCKHLCRHCPVVPVYGGRFRVVPREVVLEDIRRQVAAGAEHITFGDPDFFNGIGHALAIVTELHREYSSLTYDVTIKVEHLLAHARHLETLRKTGCLFVTTAVEAVDDGILERLQKGHTRADFERVVDLFRQIGLDLAPTFVAFTPWTTLEGYCELLEAIDLLNLVERVAPVQLGIRLLIPAGSRLLELEEVRRLIGPFCESDLAYPWRHPDPRVDGLAEEVQQIVREGLKVTQSRQAIFAKVHALALRRAGFDDQRAWLRTPPLPARTTIPYLTEPWYC